MIAEALFPGLEVHLCERRALILEVGQGEALQGWERGDAQGRDEEKRMGVRGRIGMEEG